MGDDFDDVPALDGADAEDHQGLLTALDAMLDYLKDKVAMSAEEFYALDAEAQQRAFTVSGVADLDMVSDVWTAIEKAVEDGETLQDFRARVEDGLTDAWGGEEPWRVECLTGDALVSGAVVRAAHRRWFQGDICEIVTDRGRHFSATSNHPMLTRCGWKSAGVLRPGDDLIGYHRQKHASSPGYLHEAKPPATISEIFEALASQRMIERVESSRLDFHGDGADGQVDVVRADRELRIGDLATLREPLEELLFSEAPLTTSRFCHACGHLVVVTKRCGFCDRPVRYASALKALADRLMTGAICMGQRVRALAGEVARLQFVNRQVVANYARGTAELEVQGARLATAPDRACHPENGGYPSSRSWYFRSDPQDAEASEIQIDRVRSISVRQFVGHVFNLSTAHGYYGLNGLYTGNTIFRTNVQSAYGAGRQAQNDQVRETHPFIRYDVVDDERTSEICQELIDVVVPADSDFAATHHAPLHHGCRTDEVAITEDEAEESGVVEDHEAPDVEADDGFGGILEPWVPDLSSRPPEMASIYELKLQQG